METEDKESGVGPSRTSPIENARSLNKTLSHPALCQRCEGQYTVLEEGIDAGEKFACNIMMENMEQGCMAFHCPYFIETKRVADKLVCSCEGRTCMCQPADHPNGKVIAAIIDAEKVQEAARIERLLAQGRRYQETGDVRSFTRPVIIAEEPVPGYQEPSPHPFMDPIVARINQEQATIRKVTPHVE